MSWTIWNSDWSNPVMIRLLDGSVCNEISSYSRFVSPSKRYLLRERQGIPEELKSSLKNFVRQSISAWWIVLQKTILQRCCIDLTKKPWVQYTCTDRLWRICCESFSNLDYEFMDVFKKSLQDLKILWRKVCRIEELSEDKLFPTSWRIDWCNKTIVRFQNLLKFRLWVHGSDLKVNFALFDELKFRLWVHGCFTIWRTKIQKCCEEKFLVSKNCLKKSCSLHHDASIDAIKWRCVFKTCWI